MPSMEATLACLLVLSLYSAAFSQVTATQPVSTALVVQKLMIANGRRSAALREYQCKRVYKIDYRGFPATRSAELQVEASFIAPNQKSFRVISQNGAPWLVNRVLLKLLESEKEAWQDHRQEMEFTNNNYDFSLLETQHAPQGDVYVLAVTPRDKGKYLYRGKIWVDGKDFAVTRMEGEPAKNPSFWISHTQIAQVYQKVGDFWLPAHNESVSISRFGGRAVLTIDYQNYQIAATSAAQPEPPRQGVAAVSLTP